ncbi:MAG: virB8 family protein [Caulobacterales bacterium 68-7]|nr:virB8 family protein [Caulobacterales bacterium]OJU12793.1 MAG: virB8 family protein [Caulobacterales bacterium 68-7]
MTVSDLKPYFDEAKSWDADRLRGAERSRRLAWVVAGFASLLATAAVCAVAALAPLKTVEPFVVRVDRTTGAVDVLSALKSAQPTTYDEAVTKHFLAQYVRARESWLAPAAEANFRQVSIMSTPGEQQRWADAWRAANPASPQAVYGSSGEAQIDIRAITFVSQAAPERGMPSGVAQIRFHKTVRQSQQAIESDWIATCAFVYTRAPMAEADRLRNPLGFQVTSYRADPEVVR